MKVTIALSLVVLPSLVAINAALVGCSSSSGNTGTGEENHVSDGGAARGGGSGSGSGETGDAMSAIPDASADLMCKSAGSQQACITCCQGNHKSGTSTFITALTKCECASPGACASQCAMTYCASKQMTPDMGCNACISGTLSADAGGTCAQPVQTACTADSDCFEYVGCVNSCL